MEQPSKLKRHWLLMVLCCLAVILAIIILPRYFNIGALGFILLIFLCPVLHYFLMRKMHQSHTENSDKPKEKLYQCPECGFWYREKEWAEKCEAWCKEYKSCNWEIIKHAIKVEEK